MRNNSDFGHVIAPLIQPMYVLQMARSKSWSKEAKEKHLKLFKEACAKAELRAHMALIRLETDSK